MGETRYGPTRSEAREIAAELQERIGHGTVAAGQGAYAIVDFDTLERLVGDRDRARKMLDICGTALAEIDAPVVLPKVYRDNPVGQAEWWKHTASKRREIAHDTLAALNEVSE